jgi:AbrB family looped-hinge helix DNA binding protein
MGESRVTTSYQITIPADVRAIVAIKPGEKVTVEPEDERTLVIRLRRRVKDPLLVFRRAKPVSRSPLDQRELNRLSTERD